MRYRMENIIIVGIIPGPKEPKKHMNSFLSSLVCELQEAWETGFPVTVHGCSINIKVALSCVACDIPATKKICGFLSHSAKLGCNKCLKEFPATSPGCHDYSAHLYIKQFCAKFQSLYGNGQCTINMHLHLHLRQIFMDFGPPYYYYYYLSDLSKKTG